jgi:hypothetical protein
MSNRSTQVLRRWLPRVLPTLQQGSTLSIRSSVDQSNVLIKSSWRDDGAISMIQRVKETDVKSVLKISEQADRLTSMGRDESHVLVELMQDAHIESESRGKADQSQDGIIMPDSEGATDAMRSDDPLDVDDNFSGDGASGTTLALEVPEKINIECDLCEGGSVTVENKIEGDVRIKTVDGNIMLQKLRGHSIDIEARGAGNTIFSSDLLEAESLTIRLPDSGRFRAKRVHASSCDIRMNETICESPSSDGTEANVLFDADDGGAICDISSFYVTGDATIDVQSSGKKRQAVRVKSNHGHITVQASAPIPDTTDPNTHEPFPVVDMGGVNGSCEVFLDTSDSGSSKSDAVSCRVHFDSIAPDSVSIVKAGIGSIHVTMDRKVETDIRMISCTESSSIDVDTALLDQDDEEFDDLVSMLKGMDASSQPRAEDPIRIQTGVFTAKEEQLPLPLNNVRFLDGWVENKSAEPDSRFDRKHRGETGSVGKIRLDGASNQALQNFQTNSDKNDSASTFARPIVAIVGSGRILIETLSWMGNIARRYGLDDKRVTEDLGRTATRRGRSLHPSE